MKRSKFSEEQVACALRQAESGTPAADICRQLGISEATYYLWKKEVRSPRRQRAPTTPPVEDENRWLKQLVGNLTLGTRMLSETLRK